MDRDAADPNVDVVDAWLASVADEPAMPGRDAEPAPEIAGGALQDPGALLDALAALDPPSEAGPASAAEPQGVDAAQRPLQRYVLFTVAGATYGVPEAFVTEVGRVPNTTRVPLTPPWLRGVTSLRGDVVSVIDLRTFLGLEFSPVHAGRLLVVRLLDEDVSTGLLVDTVDQIASVPVDEVRPPASPLDGALSDFLAGACHVGERFVAVLDLERLLRSPVIRQFDDVKDAKHEERSCEARI